METTQQNMEIVVKFMEKNKEKQIEKQYRKKRDNHHRVEFDDIPNSFFKSFAVQNGIEFPKNIERRALSCKLFPYWDEILKKANEQTANYTPHTKANITKCMRKWGNDEKNVGKTVNLI